MCKSGSTLGKFVYGTEIIEQVWGVSYPFLNSD